MIPRSGRIPASLLAAALLHASSAIAAERIEVPIKQTLLPVVTGVTGPNKVAQILILGIGERIRN